VVQTPPSLPPLGSLSKLPCDYSPVPKTNICINYSYLIVAIQQITLPPDISNPNAHKAHSIKKNYVSHALKLKIGITKHMILKL
jgi:hypothetical protein